MKKIMLDYNFSAQNIVDGQGISIALTGILIVFVALGLITLSITLLPKFLDYYAKFFPAKVGLQSSPNATGVKSESIIAAIGYALYQSIKGKPSDKK